MDGISSQKKKVKGEQQKKKAPHKMTVYCYKTVSDK